MINFRRIDINFDRYNLAVHQQRKAIYDFLDYIECNNSPIVHHYLKIKDKLFMLSQQLAKH